MNEELEKKVVALLEKIVDLYFDLYEKRVTHQFLKPEHILLKEQKGQFVIKISPLKEKNFPVNTKSKKRKTTRLDNHGCDFGKTFSEYLFSLGVFALLLLTNKDPFAEDLLSENL